MEAAKRHALFEKHFAAVDNSIGDGRPRPRQLVAKAAKNHCQKTTDELEKLRKINTQLLHDNMELRKQNKSLGGGGGKAKTTLMNNAFYHRHKRGTQRAVEYGVIAGNAASPLKRAAGALWVEANRNVDPQKRFKTIGPQCAENTKSMLRRLIMAVDDGNVLQDMKNEGSGRTTLAATAVPI